MKVETFPCCTAFYPIGGTYSGRSWSTTSTSKVTFSERRMRMFLAVYKCQWMSLIGSPSTLVSNTIKSVGGMEMRLGPCTIQVQGYNTGALEHMNTANTLSVACYIYTPTIKLPVLRRNLSDEAAVNTMSND